MACGDRVVQDCGVVDIEHLHLLVLGQPLLHCAQVSTEGGCHLGVGNPVTGLSSPRQHRPLRSQNLVHFSEGKHDFVRLVERQLVEQLGYDLDGFTLRRFEPCGVLF